MRIPGLPDGPSFYQTAMETLVAQGDPSQPGPSAAWFKLTVPIVQGIPTSPAMRAAAASDFGNGLSWVLPADRYLFANADLSLHLHREPRRGMDWCFFRYRGTWQRDRYHDVTPL
ncbi:hypothetical protein ACTMU2_18410 [Cupriavidus basilensis]